MDIEKIYNLPFSPAEVFTTWTSSNTVIAPATKMDINPVADGHIHLFVETPEYISFNKGKFLEVIPNESLQYTWEWDNDGHITKVSVHFNPTASGCEIKLSHRGFTKQESFQMHDSGWDSYIKGLAEFMMRP